MAKEKETTSSAFTEEEFLTLYTAFQVAPSVKLYRFTTDNGVVENTDDTLTVIDNKLNKMYGKVLERRKSGD